MLTKQRLYSIAAALACAACANAAPKIPGAEFTGTLNMGGNPATNMATLAFTNDVTVTPLGNGTIAIAGGSMLAMGGLETIADPSIDEGVGNRLYNDARYVGRTADNWAAVSNAAARSVQNGTNSFGDTIHILLWGQSNARGQTIPDPTSKTGDPLDITGITDCYVNRNDNGVDYSPTNLLIGAWYGPEMAGGKFINQATGKEVYITKVSEGGAAISDFLKGTANYGYISNKVAETQSTWPNAGPVDVVWMAQGESDTSSTALLNAYSNKLVSLEAALVSDGIIPANIPWMIGGYPLGAYTNAALGWTYAAGTEDIKQGWLASRSGGGLWFDNRDITDTQDGGGHFDWYGQDDQGERFAAWTLTLYGESNVVSQGTTTAGKTTADWGQFNRIRYRGLELEDYFADSFQTPFVSDDNLLIYVDFFRNKTADPYVCNWASEMEGTNYGTVVYAYDATMGETAMMNTTNAANYVAFPYSAWGTIATNDFTFIIRYKFDYDMVLGQAGRLIGLESTQYDLRLKELADGANRYPYFDYTGKTNGVVSNSAVLSGWATYLNSLTKDTWIDMAIVVDRNGTNTRTIHYRDGEFVNSYAEVGDFSSSWRMLTPGLLYVGRGNASATIPYAKSPISKFVLYSRVLTADEIRKIYQHGTSAIIGTRYYNPN